MLETISTMTVLKIEEYVQNQYNLDIGFKVVFNKASQRDISFSIIDINKKRINPSNDIFATVDSFGNISSPYGVDLSPLAREQAKSMNIDFDTISSADLPEYLLQFLNSAYRKHANVSPKLYGLS